LLAPGIAQGCSVSLERAFRCSVHRRAQERIRDMRWSTIPVRPEPARPCAVRCRPDPVIGDTTSLDANPSTDIINPEDCGEVGT
jgi:hypothetical protein